MKPPKLEDMADAEAIYELGAKTTLEGRRKAIVSIARAIARIRTRERARMIAITTEEHRGD